MERFRGTLGEKAFAMATRWQGMGLLHLPFTWLVVKARLGGLDGLRSISTSSAQVQESNITPRRV